MGKERLAITGYYIEYYNTLNNIPTSFSIIHISDKSKCKYIHWQWGKEWTTLLWSCAPTKKKIEDSNLNPEEKRTRYLYFTTHKEMTENINLEKYQCALIPSPNDL